MSADTVTRFERAFAEHVGAEFAVALVNGTSTIHTALAALGVEPGPEADGYDWGGRQKVAVPCLTMASTTLAVLHAGGVPVFCDVDPHTWLIDAHSVNDRLPLGATPYGVPVSLYGLHWHGGSPYVVDDAAQTLRPHGGAAFTSYSFQSSKVLSTGEGGMLCTNDEDLARKAREFSSLGYRMDAKSPRIDPATIKHPSYKRHQSIGFNYRMADAVAREGLIQMSEELQTEYGEPISYTVADLLMERRMAASCYALAVEGCSWITPQHVPDGWTHDYWSYAVALESKELWEPFTDAIVRHGGERPYGCWGITYQEPAFRHLAEDGTCPIAEDLQPRLVQAQTNNLASARTNADAWSKAIKEIGG